VAVRWSKLSVLKELLNEDHEIRWLKDDFKSAYR